MAATQQIGVLLRQAQSDAVEQESDVAWGVHFANPTGTAPFYALFTTSYSAGTVVGTPYLLPTTVAYTTSTLAPGATLDVIFPDSSGASSVSTSIGLYMPGQSAAFSSAIPFRRPAEYALKCKERFFSQPAHPLLRSFRIVDTDMRYEVRFREGVSDERRRGDAARSAESDATLSEAHLISHIRVPL